MAAEMPPMPPPTTTRSGRNDGRSTPELYEWTIPALRLATIRPMRGLYAWLTRQLPHDWRDFWIQFGVFWTFYVSYELSGHLARGERSLAMANGQRVIDVERSLGIYWEQDVQHWVLNQSNGFWLWLANNTYFNCQFTISFAFMLWVYFRRNHAFYFIRNSILFIDFIGLIGYFTLPTAPPRAFPGFVDTLHTQPLNMQSGIIKWFGNPYAAMPSLHSAYALTIGVTGVLVCRTVVMRLVWAIYPALVVFAITATANHFLLDAIAGACVAGFAFLLSLSVARGKLPRRGEAPVGFLVPPHAVTA
jgi:hypothetical protein